MPYYPPAVTPGVTSPVATDPLTLSGAITVGKTLAVTNGITADGGNTVVESPLSAYVDKTGSRALSTNYQPNTTRPTLVVFQVRCSTGDQVIFYVGPSNPANQSIGLAYTTITATGYSGFMYPAVTFIVPPGWWYRGQSNAGAPTMQGVAEYTL